MNSWFWVICPKCGGMNDSDFLDVDFIGMEYESAKQFKEENKDVVISCSDCGKDTHISLCKVVTDDDV